jgi:hypothetical protein
MVGSSRKAAIGAVRKTAMLGSAVRDAVVDPP